MRGRSDHGNLMIVQTANDKQTELLSLEAGVFHCSKLDKNKSINCIFKLFGLWFLLIYYGFYSSVTSFFFFHLLFVLSICQTSSGIDCTCHTCVILSSIAPFSRIQLAWVINFSITIHNCRPAKISDLFGTFCSVAVVGDGPFFQS